MYVSFNADRHGLVDVITFCVTCIRYRRRMGRPALSATATSTLDRLRNTIVQWIGGMLQKHVPYIYHPNHLAVDQPPPPLNTNRPGRPYTIVDPLAVWEIGKKPRAARSSFQKAIALRSDSQGLGNCSTTQAAPWLNKLSQMIRASTKPPFKSISGITWIWSLIQGHIATKNV